MDVNPFSAKHKILTTLLPTANEISTDPVFGTTFPLTMRLAAASVVDIFTETIVVPNNTPASYDPIQDANTGNTDPTDTDRCFNVEIGAFIYSIYFHQVFVFNNMIWWFDDLMIWWFDDLMISI